MADLNNEVVKLSEENNKLRKEVEDLRLRVATSRPSDNKSFSSNNASSSNNVDILKRISNLEKPFLANNHETVIILRQANLLVCFKSKKYLL